MNRRRIHALLVAASAISLTINLHAAPPNFAGVWKEDMTLSRELTESRGHTWTVAGAGAGGATARKPADDANVPTRVVTITQSPTEIVFDSLLIDYKTRAAFKLDGSETVNITSITTERSRSEWKGDRLVTTGTQFLELNTGDIVRTFERTRYIAPNGHMHVETVTKEKGRPDRIQFTVLVRQKPAPALTRK
ncbi:MAG TPA: hypothetical protein VMZ90_06925 [Vicinamibacterales bacterium]|nr:hypothetical protein [Vicinamibacterales bacterium]